MFPLDSPIFVAFVDEAAMVSRWQQAQSGTMATSPQAGAERPSAGRAGPPPRWWHRLIASRRPPAV